MKQSKILYLASEVAPFAKSGGLADVTGALPKALKAANQEIRIMMPKYKFINERKYVLREVIRLKEIPVTINGKTEVANVKSAFLPDSKVQIYFIEISDFFSRPGLYHDPKNNEPYEDNAERFAYFSKAAMETLKILSWQPDIIHCNDWQSAYVPVYLKTIYQNDVFFKGVKTIYTVHNLSNQGAFDVEKAKIIDFDESQVKEGGMFYKENKLNLTKGAVYFSDFITTVSENYANEIITNDEIGFGIGPLLDEIGDKFEGILNGVDYAVWSPEIDKLIPKSYTQEDVTPGKTENKEALLSRLGMKYTPDVPLIGIISRITEQKGFDLLIDALDDLMKLNLQMCILGDGDPELVEELVKIQKKHANKLSLNVTYDEKMAHLIEAASDLYLMPSKYEPCGLNQVYSLRYGTIPIVSAVGGLVDTVDEIDPETGEGTGFIIEELSAPGIVSTVKAALEFLKNAEKRDEIRKRIMEEDFSWEYAAKRYVDIYDRIVSE